MSEASKDGAEAPRVRRFALVALMFLLTGSFGFLQPFTPLYLEASGLAKFQIGLISALGTGAAFFIQPILGRLSDHFDTRRPFMFAAALCSGTAYLAFRHADGFLFFTLLTALGVNGNQYLNAAAGALLGRMAQATGKGGGATYVRYRVWGSVGYVFIGMTAGLLVRGRLPTGSALARAHLDPVFTYGPLLFFVIAALALVIPEVRKTSSPPSPLPLGEREGEPEEAGSSADAPLNPATPPLPVLRGDGDREARMNNLNWFCGAYFLYQFALYGASGFLSFYIRDLGGSPTMVTAMFAAGVVSEVLIMSQVGRWTDRYGRRPALAFSFLLMPLRLLLYVPATGPLWVLMVQTLHGINFGIIGTIAVVFINDLAKDAERGTMQARLLATSAIGLALGPMTCGWLADTVGIRVMFALMSVVGMAAAAVFLYGVRESNPDAVPHRYRVVRWLAGTPVEER